MKNKKSIIALLIVLCVGLVGLTIAYFSNTDTIDNLFSTKEYATTYTEEFVSPDNWLPGDTTTKTIVATNTGQIDQAVRISLTEEWKSKNGDTLSGLIDSNGILTDEEENSDKAAIINFSDNNDWTYDNGYYYYNYKLSPTESTSSLMDSVTFNPKVTLGDTCTETNNNGLKTITCSSSGDDYDNATYTLTLTIETVQYNKYNEAWNTNVAIIERVVETWNRYTTMTSNFEQIEDATEWSSSWDFWNQQDTNTGISEICNTFSEGVACIRTIDYNSIEYDETLNDGDGAYVWGDILTNIKNDFESKGASCEIDYNSPVPINCVDKVNDRINCTLNFDGRQIECYRPDRWRYISLETSYDIFWCGNQG